MSVPIPPFIPPTSPSPVGPPPVIMPPPIGWPGGVTAWGTNVRFVTCQSCGHDFPYRLSRTVTSGRQERAEARIRKVLQTECDPVPCPSCGNYQPSMIPLLRHRHRSGMRWIGALLVGAGLVACAVACGWGLRAWPVLAGLPMAGLGLILLRRRLADRLDPNSPAGSEARRTAGMQSADFVPVKNDRGIDFIVAPDATVEDIRYMNIQCLRF